MSTIVLGFFFLAFIAIFFYAIRFPALVIPLGIMTYAYKQVASIIIISFQTKGATFNYMMAGMIALIYVYNMVVRNPGVNCQTRDGRSLQISLWIFLGFFWVSILWSPYYGNDTWRFLPYFVVYFAMLPSLIESPEAMLKAFRVIWALTLLAGLGLLLSPAFKISPDIGRMVVHYETGQFNEGNPLAIADMGAYLILMSVCVLLTELVVNPENSLKRTVFILLAYAGISLGLWLAFNSSRGETFTVVICACLLIALVKGKNIGQYFLWMSGLISIIIVTVTIIFFLLLPRKDVSEFSWRYSRSSMTEASKDRMDLTTKTIEIALSSPKNFIMGIGARGCERRLGIYPHNHFVQAFGEMGIIGLSILSLSCLLTLKFGFRTLTLARRQTDSASVLFTAFIISLLVYELIVLSKKGSLTFVDTTMWISIAVFSFDRTQVLLLSNAVSYDFESDPRIFTT